MVRLTRIYTRQGDGGQTRLAGGQQVAKDAPRIRAYGTVDELNAQLGVVRTMLPEAGLPPRLLEHLDAWLLDAQHRLFDLGASLAILPEDRRSDSPAIPPEAITALEEQMDALGTSLPPLTSFVLPGGTPLAAQLHVARTVCRRAEREVVALARTAPVDAQAVPYLNRLSDALFVWSRWACVTAGAPEVLWETRR